MSYLLVNDAKPPRYIVVVVYSEYEQSSKLFLELDAAKAYAAENSASEVYVAELVTA